MAIPRRGRRHFLANAMPDAAGEQGEQLVLEQVTDLAS
jgi:hypothetical protein